ncbi:histidine kinase [Mucilaginibacter frigoritolerans]|uniref:Histidine kinase n=1 Tax=Mucilaginibacter frigoritolerans TaxID=652788 RepID=A0A562TM40_9SPHI|nr:sensor histidine kinase [Mucilaginibacter frigoritolerans]TWI94582.1 histidine kinase [Mucilaginibacter frigoritolerans]
MQKILYQNIRAFVRQKRLHLICWTIFIFYEVVITGVLLGHFSPILSYLFFYAINISLFYIHSLSVLPFALDKAIRSVWLTPLLITLELILYFALIICSEKIFFFIIGGQETPISKTFVAATIWRGIYFMLYGTGYYFLLHYIANRNKAYQSALRAEKLKTKLLRAEKDFLRAQINPHLLFNTLNFIKYAAKKKPENVEEAVLALADIMAFSLHDNHTEYVAVGTEVKQIHSVIRLNQLRFEESLQIDFSSEIADDSRLIIPVVLLTLTENLFKHGDLRKPASPAVLKIISTEECLTFTSSNLCSFSWPNEKAQHQGLKNIAARLDTYYPDNYQFVYGMSGEMFTVNLTISFPKEI